MLEKIPDTVEPSQAREELLIQDGKKMEKKGKGKKGKGKGKSETLYPVVILKDGTFNFQRATHWLKMNPNAIDLNKAHNPQAEMK